MSFFSSAIDIIKIIVTGIGAAIAVVGAIGWLEGNQNDNPAAKSAGLKGVMSGAGIALIGISLVPKLAEFFSIG